MSSLPVKPFMFLKKKVQRPAGPGKRNETFSSLSLSIGSPWFYESLSTVKMREDIRIARSRARSSHGTRAGLTAGPTAGPARCSGQHRASVRSVLREPLPANDKLTAVGPAPVLSVLSLFASGWQGPAPTASHRLEWQLPRHVPTRLAAPLFLLVLLLPHWRRSCLPFFGARARTPFFASTGGRGYPAQRSIQLLPTLSFAPAAPTASELCSCQK